MLNNKSYIGLMKSICKSHKSIGENAYAVFVNGAAPDPNVYLQHVLNRMVNFPGTFMLIQGLDSGYPKAADHVTKESRCAFLILKKFNAQNQDDHVNVLTECEMIAEEVAGMLSRFFARNRNLSFNLNELTIESVSFLGDNKCGQRVDFIVRASNSAMLAIDETRWTNPENIGFPA